MGRSDGSFSRTSLLPFSLGLERFAHADIPHLLDGYDVTGSSSAAAGNIYTLGAATALRFGSTDDLSNNYTEAHINYTSDISPSNPSDPTSPEKHSDNWGGGLLITLWKGGSLGIDLDGLTDPFEGLQTNGQKLTFGVDPFKSLTFARSSINAPLTVGKATYIGALIYQNTFELDYDWKISEESTISFDGAYSIFNPPAPNYATLLNAAGLGRFRISRTHCRVLKPGNSAAEWLMLSDRSNRYVRVRSRFAWIHLRQPVDRYEG